MTNHNPTITSSAATGSFSENTNTTGSGALHLLSGTMNFTDSDHGDTHTTTASLKSAVWSGGSGVPASSLAAINAAMSSSIQSDSNGSGKLKWNFSAADNAFDFLAKNESLVLTYNIKLNDNHGGTTTKTVTVTVTGTDDKPVIQFGAEAIVSEQDGHTLSLSPDIAHIAVGFTDVDLNNTGHTATVTGVAAAGATDGILPGALGTAELMAFIHIDNVVKNAGSSNGTINVTFAAPDLAFDYLADGETVDITYTIKLDDQKGGITTQTVVVTVVGSNDEPVYLCGPEVRHLTEGENLSPAGNLTASGDLLFTDIDLSDTHSASTMVTATRSGGGAVPLSDAQLLAAFSTAVHDSTGHLLGDVDWNFSLDNDDVAFLNSGETLTITYTVEVDDPAGGSDTQTVTITILGTNDPVMVTSGPEAVSLAEFADTTGSSAQNATTPVPTGSIAFTDTDVGDTHTVATSVASAVWSGGPAVPAATDADLAAALLTTLNDSIGTGSGSVDWTFSIADQDLDFLAAGETLTVTYDVSVSDGPTNASQTVTITVDGANDAVTITSGPGAASVAEQENTFGSSTLDSTDPVPTGTLSFSDPDLSDAHAVSVSIESAVWSANPDFVPFQTFIDLQTALSTTLQDSTGTGFGGIDWSFSIQDQDLDFLAPGETLTVVYDVTIADGATSSTQTVTITATGAVDEAHVNPLSVDVSDTLVLDAGNIIAGGNVITDAGDSPGDFSSGLTVTAVSGGTVGSSVAGAYGGVTIFTDGSYFYTANSAVDLLQVGDAVTDQFTFTVTDGGGNDTTTTVTFHIAGADDVPVITAADVTGLMTEDAGPSTLVNGGFETGDLSGWSTTSGSISAGFLGAGGGFGNYAANLGPTTTMAETLSQSVATNPGEHYVLSFFVLGDTESSSNSLTVSWNGSQVLGLVNDFDGFTQYTFDVVASSASTSLDFTYTDDGTGLWVDQVSVAPATGVPTETADGSISFSDVETGDTHTASFDPLGTGYVGTFSLGPVTESSGSGSLDWHFTVDNADIQFLSAGESLTQTYRVFVTDDHGETAPQDISVTMVGTNDAPTAVGDDNVITDADVNGGFFLPGWTLTVNDSDPDHLDVLNVNSITGESGVDASVFGGVIAFDDATLGGSFDYDTSDAHGAVSSGSGTVTMTNTAPAATLNGTSGNDIIVAVNGNEALNGNGGNDILIGNSGTHSLSGGSGDDIFAFQAVPDQGATPANAITDFDNVSDHDMVAISATAFGAGLTAGQDTSPGGIFDSTGDAEFFGSLFHYDTSNQILYFSSDGTTASAIVVAQFQPGVDLHAHDLMIV
jgi:VCBS repeat-containing protein